MKRKFFVLSLVMLVAMLLLTACGGGDETTENGGAATYPTPPAEYAGKTNPSAGDAAAATAGQATYTANCASCHGDTGKGDGPAGSSLDPHPGNLVTAAAATGDDYLFWRISEGGQMAPFNSAMPAWKGVLSEEQIWQVVTYIKTLK
jgi:mono/diheme cytochrome c family protein